MYILAQGLHVELVRRWSQDGTLVGAEFLLLAILIALWTVVDTRMIYHYTKCHISSSNGSLVIAIKPKAKYTIHNSIHFVVLHCTGNYLNKSCIVFEYLLPFQEPILSGAIVTPTLQVRASAMLVL
jgi:hypothetical protein